MLVHNKNTEIYFNIFIMYTFPIYIVSTKTNSIKNRYLIKFTKTDIHNLLTVIGKREKEFAYMFYKSKRIARPRKILQNIKQQFNTKYNLEIKNVFSEWINLKLNELIGIIESAINLFEDFDNILVNSLDNLNIRLEKCNNKRRYILDDEENILNKKQKNTIDEIFKKLEL